MNITTKEQLHINFLEAINKALDIETLYEDALQSISNFFDVERVQLWEKISNLDEMSICYEWHKENENSMIKVRVLSLPDNSKKKLEKTNFWEYTQISDDLLNKYNINSLIGLEFNFPKQNKGVLILTSKEKDKKFNLEEINFLIKIKNQLQDAAFKIEHYQRSNEDIKRLQSQNIKLRENDRLRTNFISNISHELKTPLASIIGFSKILATKNLSSETAKEISEQINLAANRLSNLITDFLEINKIETEGWLARIEPCDIGEVIKKTIEEFASLNKDYKITYSISDNYPIIKTDPKLVRQVLDNLVSNAIKYSPKGTNIAIVLESNEKENTLTISVVDRGIGIDKEELPHIFNRFYRSKNVEVQKIAGTGLGLAICKEIISTLNGNIEVESELNKGSKFKFTLLID